MKWMDRWKLQYHGKKAKTDAIVFERNDESGMILGVFDIWSSIFGPIVGLAQRRVANLKVLFRSHSADFESIL